MSPLKTFQPAEPAYLRRVTVLSDRLPGHTEFPFGMPYVAGLDLELTTNVTYFVGENGSGKSTLLEAIADLCRLPLRGGSRNELADRHAPDDNSGLSTVLRPSFVKIPTDGYFYRGEFQAHHASLLDDRFHDPDFLGDPYQAYGGKSLHERSHGEAFLNVVLNRFSAGIFLMDEPESALSPQRQLSLLVRMFELQKHGRSQFIIATHSPILLTYPGARILSFDDDDLREIELRNTAHYQVTKAALDSPERLWRHLTEPDQQ